MRENLPLSIYGLFITAHPFFFSSFCYPLSVVLHPSSVRRLFLSSFSSRRKNAPFGLRALVASVVPIEKESERLRFSPFALSPLFPLSPLSFFFFSSKTREAKLSARKLETIFPPQVLRAYARKQTRAPDTIRMEMTRRFSSLGSPISLTHLAPPRPVT